MLVSLCRLGEEPFKCSKCNTGFAVKNQWIKHIISADHTESLSSIDSSSENCDQRLSKRVESVVQEERESSKTCGICGKVFARKYGLKCHIASVHEGKKPYKCDICQFSSSEKRDLKRHVTAVHEGEKPFKCDLCSNYFSTMGNLKKHIKQVTLRSS